MTYTFVGSILYFDATDGTAGIELWKSDGTPTGTQLVKDIKTGSGSSYPSNFINAGGSIYFTADDGIHGIELWKSNGTPLGTDIVIDQNPGSMNGVSALLN